MRTWVDHAFAVQENPAADLTRDRFGGKGETLSTGLGAKRNWIGRGEAVDPGTLESHLNEGVISAV